MEKGLGNRTPTAERDRRTITDYAKRGFLAEGLTASCIATEDASELCKKPVQHSFDTAVKEAAATSGTPKQQGGKARTISIFFTLTSSRASCHRPPYSRCASRAPLSEPGSSPAFFLLLTSLSLLLVSQTMSTAVDLLLAVLSFSPANSRLFISRSFFFFRCGARCG